MTVKEKYAMFEDYLNDELTDVQRANFERRLEQDSVLLEELAFYRETRDAISARIKWEASKKPFMPTLEGLSKAYFKSDQRARLVSLPRRSLILQVMGAAAILLLIVLVWQPWQKDLYTRYAQHPRADLTERDASSNLSTGERAFNNNEYASALDAFTQHLTDEPGDADVLLFQGICYLELDKEDNAKQNFRQLFNSAQPYKDTGAWYLGLTFLKQNTIDSTAYYLSQIRESSEYYQNAQTLLKKL